MAGMSFDQLERTLSSLAALARASDIGPGVTLSIPPDFLWELIKVIEQLLDALADAIAEAYPDQVTTEYANVIDMAEHLQWSRPK